MKKIATFIGSAALLAAAVIPAIAASNECTNGTTGPFSNNTCTIRNTDNVTVNNVNDAQIVNDIESKSNTGHNSTSYNTLGGIILTGDATNNTTVSSVANINTTNITSALAGISNIGSNNITGPYSDNQIWLDNEHRADVLNSNTASVYNDVEAKSNTGFNDADYNTGPASVTAGDAWLGLGVNTHANDNMTVIGGGYSGGIVNLAENLTTGPFSTQNVTIYNRARARVNNVNDMQVVNDVDAKSNSGFSSASYNTLGGDVTSGDSAAGVLVDTEGNINTTRIALAMGGFGNTGTQAITGPYAYDATYIENVRDIVVDNWNNKCRSHNADRLEENPFEDEREDEDECEPENLGVLNDVEVKSNTGKNDGDYNTGGGSVTAGFAELWQQVLTHLNDTLTEIH